MNETRSRTGRIEAAVAQARVGMRRTESHRMQDPVDYTYARVEDLLDMLVNERTPPPEDLAPLRGLFRPDALEVYRQLRRDGVPGRAAVTAAGLI